MKTNRSRSRNGPRRSPGANSPRHCSAALKIELIAVRHPAIAALPFLDIANAWKWHMKTSDEQLVSRQHIEHPLASGDGLVFVVVHFEMPFWPLHRHHVLRACVGGDHNSLAVV